MSSHNKTGLSQGPAGKQLKIDTGRANASTQTDLTDTGRANASTQTDPMDKAPKHRAPRAMQKAAMLPKIDTTRANAVYKRDPTDKTPKHRNPRAAQKIAMLTPIDTARANRYYEPSLERISPVEMGFLSSDIQGEASLKGEKSTSEGKKPTLLSPIDIGDANTYYPHSPTAFSPGYLRGNFQGDTSSKKEESATEDKSPIGADYADNYYPRSPGVVLPPGTGFYRREVTEGASEQGEASSKKKEESATEDRSPIGADYANDYYPRSPGVLSPGMGFYRREVIEGASEQGEASLKEDVEFLIVDKPLIDTGSAIEYYPRSPRPSSPIGFYRRDATEGTPEQGKTSSKEDDEYVIVEKSPIDTGRDNAYGPISPVWMGFLKEESSGTEGKHPSEL